MCDKDAALRYAERGESKDDASDLSRQGISMDTPTIDLVVRSWRSTDNVTQLTAMLHRAYRPLAEAGMRFLASHQDDAVTRERLEGGLSFVAETADRVVGVIVYHPPLNNIRNSLQGVRNTTGVAIYDRPDVGWFEQFAVDPEWQGRGIASRLLNHIEQMAHDDGAAAIALDTSEQATHLINLYIRRGYRIVDFISWTGVTNYRSVIMSKPTQANQ